jgi:PKD domain
MNKLLALAAATVFCGAAAAQTLSGIKVEPATAKVGEPVKITGTFENADNPNCNVRVNFGDGPTQNFKINQAKDVPLVATHTYAKPGAYKVAIEPRTVMPMLKCVGKDQSAMVTVVAPAPVVAAAPAGKPAAAAPAKCPAGWKLSAKSVNKKTGAFTCTAKAGTALPSAKLECAAPLGYFENKAKGQLGCRP